MGRPYALVPGNETVWPRRAPQERLEEFDRLIVHEGIAAVLEVLRRERKARNRFIPPGPLPRRSESKP